MLTPPVSLSAFLFATGIVCYDLWRSRSYFSQVGARGGPSREVAHLTEPGERKKSNNYHGNRDATRSRASETRYRTAGRSTEVCTVKTASLVCQAGYRRS